MADTKTEPSVPVNRDGNGNIVCVLVDPFEVGDCQMNAGAQVQLSVPGDGGTSAITWVADVFSKHPQPFVGDTWHQTFRFKTRRGTVVATSDRFDSPGLNNANEVQHVFVNGSVVVDPDLFDGIKAVDWTAEC